MAFTPHKRGSHNELIKKEAHDNLRVEVRQRAYCCIVLALGNMHCPWRDDAVAIEQHSYGAPLSCHDSVVPGLLRVAVRVCSAKRNAAFS